MAFGENTPMARRRLLQDESPATEAMPFAAAVPASAVALGAIPEDNDPPTTPPSADRTAGPPGCFDERPT